MNVTIQLDEVTPNPFAENGTIRSKLRKYATLLRALASGGLRGRSGSSHPALIVGTATASAVVTPNAVVTGNTCTLNGQALTATQHHATGTVTPTVSGIDEGDELVVDGTTFTAAAAEDLEAGEFDVSGTDAECVASIVACINAAPDLVDVVTATGTATVATIRAVSPGTAGSSIVLTSSDAQLAVSGAGTLAGGAAVGNNQFDFTGTDAQTAELLADAINDSSTAAVNTQVTAEAVDGVVTISAIHAGKAGNAITIAATATRLAITGGVSRLAGGDEDSFTF